MAKQPNTPVGETRFKARNWMEYGLIGLGVGARVSVTGTTDSTMSTPMRVNGKVCSALRNARLRVPASEASRVTVM